MPVHRDPQSGDVLYTWTTGETIKRLLAVEDELLRSEGIDPPWVPFTEAELAEASRSAVLLDELELLDANDREVQRHAAVVGDLDFLVVPVVADDGADGADRPSAGRVGVVGLVDRLGKGDDVDFADCRLIGGHDHSQR
jgi:hypothetical protein